MKRNYIDPKIEITNLYTEDVITTSPGDGNSGEDIPGITLPEDKFPED